MKPMKTAFISALALAAMAATATSASADAASGFYIGLDGRIDQISFKDKTFTANLYDTVDRQPVTTRSPHTQSASDFPEGLMGAGVVLGYRFSPHWAVEAGFTSTADENRVADNNKYFYRYRMTIREAQLDGYAFLPLGPSGRFRPFLTAGMAYAAGNGRMEANQDTLDASGTRVGVETLVPYVVKKQVLWRAGAGLEIGISQSVAGRVYARYQPYSFGSTVNGGASLGFNLTYMFL